MRPSTGSPEKCRLEKYRLKVLFTVGSVVSMLDLMLGQQLELILAGYTGLLFLCWRRSGLEKGRLDMLHKCRLDI